MAPLVSVVMPCFNAGPMLEPALWSVFAQSYPNIEFIFVDNNSSDGSAERARSFAAGKERPFRFVHCSDQGANHARNMGYALAQGDYIQWLDADDALGIEKIALQVDALEHDREAAIAYCDWMASRHLPDGNRIDRVNALSQVDDQIQRTVSGVWYPPHSYLFRREAAELLHAERAWLPETKIGTDVEYSAIAALLGMRFRHVAAAKVQYNLWSSTQTSGTGTPYAARVAAFRQIWLRLQEFARRPEVAARITAAHRILLDQDWTVWTMPLGSVEVSTLSGQRHGLRHVVSGRLIEADSREATIATVLLATGLSRALLHHAHLIATAAPALNNGYADIVSILDRFRREGLLTAVDLASEAPDDEPETVASPLAKAQERDASVSQGALPARSTEAAAAFPHRAAALETRNIVADAWTEVLRGRGLAENQRFDAAGGDSLALVNLALSFEASLGVPVSLDALSLRMRPSDFVRVLDRSLSDDAGASADTATVKSGLPTIFLVRARHHVDWSEAFLRQACAGLANIVAISLPAWPLFIRPDFDVPALLDHIVAEIEPRIGREPVRLFGLCYGGILAYLAAQRLASRGKHIGFLGIVDGDPQWAVRGVPPHIRAMGEAVRAGPQFSGMAPAAARWLARHPRWLRYLGRNGLIERLPRKFAAQLNWHLNSDLPMWFDRGGLATALKTNSSFNAPVVLFRPLEQPEGTPADLHWRERCGQLTVVPVLGHHYSLFAPRNSLVLHQAISLVVRRVILRSDPAPGSAPAPGSLAQYANTNRPPLRATGDDDLRAGIGIAAPDRQIA